MTDSTSISPPTDLIEIIKPLVQPLTPAQVRAHRRVISHCQSQIVAAARERVPNLTVAAELPAIVARGKLKAARRQFGKDANRFLNRATRRSLAREVGLA